MPWMNVVAVGAGAALGACARWGLSMLLNPVFASVPLGTLVANLIGGLLIGVAMTLADPLGLSVPTRLMLITGFLGGLTTFSTFSAETVGLFMRGAAPWAGALVALHVIGSLMCTGAGVAIARAVLVR